MVFAVLRHAHDRSSSVLGHELSWPAVGVHDGVRLGKVGSSTESRTKSIDRLANSSCAVLILRARATRANTVC